VESVEPPEATVAEGTVPDEAAGTIPEAGAPSGEPAGPAHEAQQQAANGKASPGAGSRLGAWSRDAYGRLSNRFSNFDGKAAVRNFAFTESLLASGYFLGWETEPYTTDLYLESLITKQPGEEAPGAPEVAPTGR
jgi:hypothetical protein